ncbi:hypothetical protein QJS66_02570 [Kocuria rhizophila]|nr:hypothetical protein QJS66_02570 [Kocuria rhizophila]
MTGCPDRPTLTPPRRRSRASGPPGPRGPRVPPPDGGRGRGRGPDPHGRRGDAEDAGWRGWPRPRTARRWPWPPAPPDLRLVGVRNCRDVGGRRGRGASRRGPDRPVVLLARLHQRRLVERARGAGHRLRGQAVPPWTAWVRDAVAMCRFEGDRGAVERGVADMKEQFRHRKLVERAKSLLHQGGLSKPEGVPLDPEDLHRPQTVHARGREAIVDRVA